eukprot:Phypoly_transcript_04629.p1 GENE.Phypoly_transcript_04629~~Phypoly_transcript_04629.p1  ORF type:complete len:708 (+),score=159.25 Phypoly_transcript_04629:32-2125(+)
MGDNNDLIRQFDLKWETCEKEESDEALQEAIDFGTKLAKQGDPEIQYRLGEKFIDLGLEEDGFEWYKKASQKGHIKATHALGECYRKGTGTEKNDQKAFSTYSKAANQGYSPSMYIIGYMYHHGNGVEKDLKASFEWYKKAVETEEKKEVKSSCYIPSLNNLARCYNHGFGTEANGELANKYYQAASDLGDAIATHNMGINYQMGQNVPVDAKKAATYYKKGAALGMAESYFSLAEMYSSGEGVRKNQVKSVICTVRAAERHHGQALGIVLNSKEMPEKLIPVNILGQATNLRLSEMGEPCDPQKLADLETKIKGRLPRDYKVFLQKYNGGVTIYSAMMAKDGRTTDNGVEHYFDIDEMLQLNPYPGISRNAIVFGEDAGNNAHYLYFKGPKRGQVHFYDADMGETQKEDVFPCVANSFLQFIKKAVALDTIVSAAFGAGYEQEVEYISVPAIDDEKDVGEETEDGGVPEEGDESADAEEFTKIVKFIPISEANEDPELKKEVDRLMEHSRAMQAKFDGKEEETEGEIAENKGDSKSSDTEKGDEKGDAEKDDAEKGDAEKGDEGANMEGGEAKEEGETKTQKASFKMPFLGYIAEEQGYVRTRDYMLADDVLSVLWDRPIGPLFRHQNKLMWDYGVYNKVSKKGDMKGLFTLVPKQIGSVVWGKLPRVSGSFAFVQAAKAGAIKNDKRNYLIMYQH